MRRARPAGDYDYEARGDGYATRRRADPRIAALIDAALGDASTVLNVGAGAGSYEPEGRLVIAVEPSARMRSQRPAGRLPAIDAVAERLPFDDNAFDAAMASVTVHQLGDVEAGLRLLRRVSSGHVVILTFDGEQVGRLWLADYVPELFAAESRRYPAIDVIGETLGGDVVVTDVPVPIDCTDGFLEAFYARPEAFLDHAVRAGQSAWGFIDPHAIDRGLARLAEDLRSGAWDAKYGHLRQQDAFAGSLRLIVG
jgi:hypothetical protein